MIAFWLFMVFVSIFVLPFYIGKMQMKEWIKDDEKWSKYDEK